MSQNARVNSIVMLKELRSALAAFAETASVALDEVSSEIQRTVVWLNEDRRRHWKNEVRLRTEQQVQAKLALKRKGVFDLALTGGRTSAIDEKKALAKAERRLQEARQRLARTQSWIQRIDKELSDYRAASVGLTGAIDADIPNARARLEKMVESLEAYVALAPPVAREPVGQEAGDGISQPAVLRPAPGATPPDRTAEALRKTTPAADVREKTSISSEPVDWVARIELSESLREVSLGDGIEPVEARPDDMVLLAVPRDEPSTVYLERTAVADGDSGWYVGVGNTTDRDVYTAVRISDLLKACPHLVSILNWPVGYLLRIDVPKEMEAVFDARDTLLWQNTHSDEPGREQ
ncbi:MAG: immunity protein Imm33 domain-containing protein [Planctomycetota bacterium]|jgi:hypothetical protein